MKDCQQAKGQSIYEHGMDVANRYRDLHTILGMYSVIGCYKWSIPDDTYLQLRKIQKSAIVPKNARTYHIFHDCGKPSCKIIDEQGKAHFPNHAQVSTAMFREAFDDEQSAQLIELDMACHTLKGEAADEFAKNPLASTLILTAWSELHSNAETLFGGYETDSFKIKRKHLIKITQKIYRSIANSD